MGVCSRRVCTCSPGYSRNHRCCQTPFKKTSIRDRHQSANDPAFALLPHRKLTRLRIGGKIRSAVLNAHVPLQAGVPLADASFSIFPQQLCIWGNNGPSAKYPAWWGNHRTIHYCHVETSSPHVEMPSSRRHRRGASHTKSGPCLGPYPLRAPHTAWAWRQRPYGLPTAAPQRA